MKISKKIIVSSLASVMAVSLVGAVTGTVAWYQYSTRATVSMIGMNVAETGILEISKDGSNWTRDLTSADLALEGSRAAGDFSITPMTWGVAANQTASSALPANAYKNPDVVDKTVDSSGADYATRGSFATAWDEASAQNDYIQYKIYLRARTVDNATGGFTQKAEKVYLTDYVLNDLGSGAIAAGLRVHLGLDADGNGTDDSSLLLSKGTVSALPLSGNLDQDNDGIVDRVGGYEWATHRSDNIVYGAGDYTQTTETFANKLATRDSDGVISGQDGKVILTTPASGAAIITVTIWLEGWDTTVGQKTVTKYTYDGGSVIAADTSVAGKFELYDLNGTPVANNYVPTKDSVADGVKTYYTQTADASYKVADWSGLNTDGAKFQFGLTFDVGRGSFAD